MDTVKTLNPPYMLAIRRFAISTYSRSCSTTATLLAPLLSAA